MILMNMQRSLKSICIVWLIFLLACAPEGKLEEVNYRLKWLYNVSTIGDLYAEAQGYFARSGLKVNVKAGGPERDALKELELGHAQFGVASADQVLRAVAKGSPIVVLAQLFQVNPLNWIYRPDKTPFAAPEDLKGKTIGVTFGGNDETILRALLARYAIAESEVNLFSVRYDYVPFYEGKVDFWPLYLNAEAVVIGDKLAEAGEHYAFMSPDKLGVRFVANSVVTTREMVEKHSETVKRFLAALLQGWRDALEPSNADDAGCTQRVREDRRERLEADRADHAGPESNSRPGRCGCTAVGRVAKVDGQQGSCAKGIRSESRSPFRLKPRS
jgi:NitT/TauT family transport system substrate-binding protein